MSSDGLELHPELQRLTDANALLRDEVTRLLTEVEDLVRITKPNLLALYQTRIGVWELRALEAHFAVARLRRQVELEFLAWQTKVREAAERIQAAEARLQHLLPPADDRALKELYHTLVKRLHPDLSPNLNDDQRRLWLRVQSAYAAGDVPELRALALLAESSAAVPPPPRSLDQLRQERMVLEAQIVALLKRVEQIECQPPFTLRRQLADEAWLATRRQELDQRTAALLRQGEGLQAQWRALLGGTGHGTVFGPN